MMSVYKKKLVNNKEVIKRRKWKEAHYQVLFDTLIMQCMYDGRKPDGSGWFDHARYVNFRNHCKKKSIRVDMELNRLAGEPQYTDVLNKPTKKAKSVKTKSAKPE
jgi:hypothetical protein